jgi:mannose-6-phosphate isomerase
MRYGGSKVGEAYLLSTIDGKSSLTSIGLPFSSYLMQSHRDSLQFPVLIKAIDAKEPLSVQVHPDDISAQKLGTHGKHELWVIDQCRGNAAVYVGFCEDVTVVDIVRRCAEGTILSLLNRIPVYGGEVIFVPAGTVHAIGGGVSLYEIQQNADLTYRLYDYGRGRNTQLEKALSVLHMQGTTPQVTSLNGGPLFEGEKDFPFAVDCCRFDGDTCCAAREDTAVLFLEGKGSFAATGCRDDYAAGDCFFIPQNSRFTLFGKGKVLHIAVKN